MPSDEVLAHFVAVRWFGAGATLYERRVALMLIRGLPSFREFWLDAHAAFEEQLRRNPGAAA